MGHRPSRRHWRGASGLWKVSDEAQGSRGRRTTPLGVRRDHLDDSSNSVEPPWQQAWPGTERKEEGRQAQPEPSTTVATVVEVVRTDGSTVTQFTVSTIPATVSGSQIGTVQPESNSAVATSPPTPIPAPAEVTSQPPAPSSSAPDSGSFSNPSTSDTPTPTESPIDTSSLPTSAPETITPTPTPTEPGSSTELIVPTSSSAEPTSEPATSSFTPTSSEVPSETASETPSATESTSASATASSSEPSSSTASETTTYSTSVLATSSSATTTETTISSSIYSSSTLLTTSSLSTSTILSSTSSTTIASETATSSTYGGMWANPTGGPETATPAPAPKAPPVEVPQVVGGVVGGVMGAVLILVLFIFLLRLRRRHLPPHALGSASGTDMSGTAPLAGAAAGVSRLMNRWRRSSLSFVGAPPPGEQGFQKLGGRKIQSVLESGGDGYDNSFGIYTNEKTALATAPAPPPESPGPSVTTYAIADDNWQRQQRGAPGPKQLPPSFSSPPLGRPSSLESDTSDQVVFHPSPARTPLSSATNLTTGRGVYAAASRPPTAPPATPLPPVPGIRPGDPPSNLGSPRIGPMPVAGGDGIGRSLASADNSRASRFAEGL